MRLTEFFYFNKSDRSALLFLLAVGCLVALFFWLGGNGEDRTPLSEADSLDMVRNRTYVLSDKHYSRNRRSYYYATATKSAERFPFDPNTADATQLLRLGLRPWQVKNIYKYRAAGGIYRRPEDFARLYGLTRKEYRELQPYIRISDENIVASPVHLALWRESQLERTTVMTYSDDVRHLMTIMQPERQTLNQLVRRSGLKRPKVIALLARLLRFGVVRWEYQAPQFLFSV